MNRNKTSRVIATIGTILMAIAILILISCATVTKAEVIEPNWAIDSMVEGKKLPTLVKKVNKLGRSITKSVNIMSVYAYKMKPGMEAKHAEVAVIQLKRICQVHFTSYTLIKMGMSMKEFYDIITVFAVADALANKIYKDSMSYAVKSAKKNAKASNDKKFIKDVDKAIEMSVKLSELYEEIFETFYKILNDNQRSGAAKTFKI